jgi:hypothetical protein
MIVDDLHVQLNLVYHHDHDRDQVYDDHLKVTEDHVIDQLYCFFYDLS